MGQMFFFSLVSGIGWLLLYGKVESSVLMLPLENTEEMILDIARSGDIPQDLLRDILIEASKYKTLHNQNPSEFLESANLFLQDKRGPMRKKMTSGIVGLTRPRFGKRSWEPYKNILSSDLMSPLARTIFNYMCHHSHDKYPEVNHLTNPTIPNEIEKEFILSLKKPRFGKKDSLERGSLAI